MKRIGIVIGGIIVIALLIAIYLFTKKTQGIQNKSPDFTLTPQQFIQAFLKNPKQADNLYQNKVIQLQGVPHKTMEKPLKIVYQAPEYSIDILLDTTLYQKVPEQILSVKALYIGYEAPDSLLELPGVIRLQYGVINPQ